MEALRLCTPDGIDLDAAVHPAVAGVPRAGTVVLAHGITTDKDEGGMFVRLADRLAEAGITAVRFTFRGHGDSGGTPEGVTIAGQMLDLQTVVDHSLARFPGPLSIVATNFGAVSTGMSMSWLSRRLAGLVLWNPVLDLVGTFLEPELRWGLENFSPEVVAGSVRKRYLLIDGEFELGRALYTEMWFHKPAEEFAAADVPALVVHGDADTYVSYRAVRRATLSRFDWDLFTVTGSDHGFGSREHEDDAITATVVWLARRHSVRSSRKR